MESTRCKERASIPGKFRQVIATIIVNLSTLSYGLSVGWPSGMIPHLQSNETSLGGLPMTDEEVSWLSGALCLGGIVGTLLIGFVAEPHLGRKMTGYVIALPLTAGWILTIFATRPAHLYAARFAAGLAGAGSLLLVPLYVSEISLDELRGTLGTLLALLLNIGILLAYLFAAFLSFRFFAICALLIPLFYIAGFSFLPESPVYLLRRNRTYEAARSLMWLRASRNSVLVDGELARFQARLNELSPGSSRFRDFFRNRGTIKGLIIVLGLFMGQQLCGIFAMISYTETIFEMSGSWMAPNAAAITIASIQTFGSYVSTTLIERAGRKVLLVLSCAGTCLCHYAIGTYCLFRENGYHVSTFSWLPVVGLSTFVIVFNLGMGPVPYIIVSETLPPDLASLALTIGLLVTWAMAFLVLKFFALVVLFTGIYGCFYLLGTFCLCTLFFALLLVPETKGRSIESILQELNGSPPLEPSTDFSYTETLSAK